MVSNGPTALVEMRSVYRTYTAVGQVQALRGIDLAIDRGEYVAVVGPSGSGKSTLLNILGCLDTPTSGSYALAGVDTIKLPDVDRTALRAEFVGFVFQAFRLLGHRTVMENVLLGSLYRHRPKQQRIARALEAISLVGMSHRASFLARDLSGGEQQRVAIARALAQEPQLLLCDEPSGNLDSESTRSLLDLFDDLIALGLTIVWVTHDPVVADRAHRCVTITDGRLSTTGNRE